MKGIRLKKAVLSDFRFAVQMSHNVETHVILEIPCFYPPLHQNLWAKSGSGSSPTNSGEEAFTV